MAKLTHENEHGYRNDTNVDMDKDKDTCADTGTDMVKGTVMETGMNTDTYGHGQCSAMDMDRVRHGHGRTRIWTLSGT